MIQFFILFKKKRGKTLHSLYTMPITLKVSDEKEKRQKILKYFLNSYSTFEKLFDMFKDDTVFYKKSEITRHPMIFYFGHTSTFFINKLILAKVIDKRINANFESMFAVGVDEMSWDDLNEKRYAWPKISEVREYRDRVKDIISNLILTLPLSNQIKQTDAMWIILMGIEHERIHIETSSVLHRQMDIKFIKEIDDFPICKIDNEIKQNSMIKIEKSKIKLGKDKNHHLYGWDNEYGTFNSTVDKFKVSKYLVSNAEFLEFVENNGYITDEYWNDEGKKFLNLTKSSYPTFWIKQSNGEFKYRTIMSEIDMPWSWPVDVNSLEAYAFCRWKSKKDSIDYTLPSEEQFYALYERANLKDIPNFDDSKANINLRYFASATPIDMFRFDDIYDVVGNVWQWSRTPIYPYKGFKIHPIYDDFSVPTFDNKHNLLKGGSFISTGNEMMKHSRYAFRRHFYQHAGFRYVQGDEYLDIKSFKKDTNFNDKTFNIKEVFDYIRQNIQNKNNIFEIGCGLGDSSVELSKIYTNIVAVDTTARVIKEAEFKNKKDNITFWQVDPCNLKPHFKDYDLIIINNILNRIYSPLSLLNELPNRLTKDGIVVTIGNDDFNSLNDNFKQLSSKQIDNIDVILWEII